jgi:hypothetical protein
MREYKEKWLIEECNLQKRGLSPGSSLGQYHSSTRGSPGILSTSGTATPKHRRSAIDVAAPVGNQERQTYLSYLRYIALHAAPVISASLACPSCHLTCARTFHVPW